MEKATRVTFNPSILVNGFVTQKANTGIKDPYLNKYYGEQSYSDLLASANGARAKIVSEQETRKRGFNPFVNSSFSFGRFSQNINDLLSSQLTSIFIPNKEDYIQFDKVNQSFNAFEGDWNKFFEGNYKNPRVTEEQNNRQAKGQQRFQQQATLASALQDLTVAQESPTTGSRRITGTGVGTSSFNPFSAMEAGLGL